MASIDAKEGGIYAWMTSVRASMANDPCRQLFEDQIQTHAFVFLDDYLEQILAGPKKGPIIELVKTPGRKNNVPRRTRAAAAAVKVKNTSLFSLDGDDSANVDVPVNNFHKALLQVKERSPQGVPDPRKFPTGPISTLNPSAEKTLLAVERGTELSVIAEGNESPERSHVSMLPLSITPNRDGLPETVPLSRGAAEDYPATEGNLKAIRSTASSKEHLPDARYSVPSSVDTYHSIPLDSLLGVQLPETGSDDHTGPLPSRTAVRSPRDGERNAFTAPLPTVPSNSIPIPHTISVPLNDSSPRTLAHKSGTTGFPLLPAPSPLRKSMRVMQEALIGPAIPSTVPALVPLGKRTSWLMKAREAKAMEGTSSFQGNPVVALTVTVPRVSTAVKRKSEEMLDPLLSRPDREKDQRNPKVAKSTGVAVVPLIPVETEKTNRRDFPSVQSDPIPLSSIAAAVPVHQLEPHAMDVDEQIHHVDSTEEGFIDLFKRTVEGLGARTGKSMGKSLGGAAAAALAEARAAAEAKVAERNKVDGESGDPEVVQGVALPDQKSFETRAQSDDRPPFVLGPSAEVTEHPLKLSDLAPDTVQSDKLELPMRTAKTMVGGTRTDIANGSIPTTPPDSPPSKGTSSFVKPVGPVFNKPPPVFMPPAPKQPSVVPGQLKELSSDFPLGKRTLPAAVSVGIPARLPPSSNGFSTHAQGTTSLQPLQSRAFSDSIFGKREGTPAWDPSTQDTQYTIGSLPRNVQGKTVVVVDDDDDDDDSWPLEEKLAAAEPGWRPFDFSNVDKEDTWSSLPTESQGPTRNLTTEKNGDPASLASNEVEENDEEEKQEKDVVEFSDDEDSVMEVRELETTAEAVATSLGRVEPTARGTSQTSTTSTASSSQSQTGFFSQATKLVNTMLGGGKKTKPELKSLQLAATAAKRQQEEADKKTQRLKDMETRRQMAIAKRAEERTRLQEEEKKSKEELEKRKREREENTDRRPLKLPMSTRKAEDDASKKRRLAPETDKKPESKKVPSKDKKDLGAPTKPAVTPATKLAAQKVTKAATAALVSSAAYNTTQNAPPASSTKPVIPEAKPFKVVSSLKGKVKAKPQEGDMGDKLPSTVVQSQMAARAKAQMQAAKLPTPEVSSESIELPEINSEYSDSEDEDRVRTFDPPDWAQSPELRQALQMQSTMNPDSIFGAIRPLRMEEMFRTRQSRFRARTSSANWSGTDRLTVEEIREYERRMGFQQTGAS